MKINARKSRKYLIIALLSIFINGVSFSVTLTGDLKLKKGQNENDTDKGNLGIDHREWDKKNKKNHAGGFATGNFATAFGVGAQASGDGATAYGNNTRAGNHSIALGGAYKIGELGANAIGDGSIAIGASAAVGKISRDQNSRITSVVGVDNAVAIGTYAVAQKNNTVAIGNKAEAIGENSISIGKDSKAQQASSIAIGNKAQNFGLNSVIIGENINSNGKNNFIFGTNLDLKNGFSNVISLGNNEINTMRITKAHSVILGNNASVSVEGGIALGEGSNSTRKGNEKGYDLYSKSKNINDWNKRKEYFDYYDNDEDYAPNDEKRGALDIGKRQITSVTAGSEDTDAVNLKQLKSVTLRFNGDNKNEQKFKLHNDTFEIKGEGEDIKTEAKDNNKLIIKLNKSNNVTQNDEKVVTSKAVYDYIENKVQNISSDFKFGANGKVDQTINLKDGLTFNGDKNILVESKKESNKGIVTYKLKNELRGITSISKDDNENGTKITLGDDKISLSGSNNNGIILTGLSDGKISENSKDAITGKQLNDLANKLGITSENKNFSTVKFEKIKIESGNNGETASTTFKDAIEKNIKAINKGFKIEAFEYENDSKDKTQYLGSKTSFVQTGNGINKNNNKYVGTNLITKYKYNTNTGDGTVEIGFREEPEFKSIKLGENNKKTITTNNQGDLIIKNGGTNVQTEEKIITESEFRNLAKLKYKANLKDEQEVDITTGLNFKDDENKNITVTVAKDGEVKHKLSSELNNITSISKVKNGNGAKITLEDDKINVNKPIVLNESKTPKAGESDDYGKENDGKNVATEGAVKALKELGIKFQGNKKDEDVNRQLGQTLSIRGEIKEVDINSFKSAEGNILVTKNPKENIYGLLVKLSKDLKEIDSISKDNNGNLTKIALGDGIVTLSKENNNNDGVMLTGLKDGKIEENSKEAITGQQLKNLAGKIGIEVDDTNGKTKFKDIDYNDFKLKNVNGEDTTFKNGKTLVDAVKANINKLNQGFKIEASEYANDSKDKVQYLGSKTLFIQTDNKGIIKIEENNTNVNYVGDNLLTRYTYNEGNGKIEIGLREIPRFKAIELGDNVNDKIKITPDVNNNTLTITNSSDNKVIIKGLKDGGDNDTDSAVTKGTFDKLEEKLGLKGKNGEKGEKGDVGPSGQDGLADKSIIDKVEALREGSAGVVVYTDKEGNRVVLGKDGKYYKYEEIKDKKYVDKTGKKGYYNDEEGNGDKVAEIADKDIIASVVNPNGETKKTTIISNIDSNLLTKPSEISKKYNEKNTMKEGIKLAQDAATILNSFKDESDKAKLNSAATLRDLQAISIAGLTFKANKGDDIHRPLGTILQIVGENKTNVSEYSNKNIITETKVDDGIIEIKLSQKPEFKEIKLTGENNNSKNKTITVDTDGNLVIKDDKDTTKIKIGDGSVTLSNDKNDGGTYNTVLLKGISKGKEDNDAVNKSQLSEVLSKLGGGATISENGDITGPTFNLKAGNKNTVSEAIEALDKNIGDLGSKKLKFKGNDNEEIEKSLGETLEIKGEGNFVGKTAANNIVVNKTKDSNELEIKLAENLVGINKITTKGHTNAKVYTEIEDSGIKSYNKDGGLESELSSSGLDLKSTGNDKEETKVTKSGVEIFENYSVANSKKSNVLNKESITLKDISDDLKNENKITASSNIIKDKNGNETKIESSKISIKKDNKVLELTNDSINSNGYKITFGNNGITLSKGTNGEAKVTLSGIKDGSAPNDAVNVSQLERTTAAVKTKITSDNNTINIIESKNEAGATEYDLGVSKASIIISDEGVITSNDENSFVTGKNLADNVNKAVDSARTELKDGKNTIVNVIKGNKGQYIYNVDLTSEIKDINSIKVGKKEEDGLVEIVGKDKSSVIINGKDGSIGLSGENGKNYIKIKSISGKSDLDSKNNKNRITYDHFNEEGNSVIDELSTLNDGLIFTGNNKVLNKHKLNTTVKVLGDGNINVEADGNDTLNVKLSSDLNNIESISNGKTKIILEKDKINVNDSRIAGVENGVEEKDAVNVSQLRNIKNTIGDRFKEVDKRISIAVSGVANALATANLTQVSYRGLYKNQISAAYGYYSGEHAIAAGLSGISKNGKLIYKLSGSINTKGNLGVGVGLGYQFNKDDTNDISSDNKEQLLNNILDLKLQLKNSNDKLGKAEDELSKTKGELQKTNDKIKKLENLVNKFINSKTKLYVVKGYEIDKYNLTKKQNEILKMYVKEINEKYKGKNIEITGYTDTNAGEKYNLDLGLRRAKGLADKLIKLGLDKSITIEKVSSFGYNNVISTTNTTEGRAENRRVEILIK